MSTLISNVNAGETGFSDNILVKATPLDGIFGKNYTTWLPVFLVTDTPFDGGEAVDIHVKILESSLPIQVHLIFYKEYSLLYSNGYTQTTDHKDYLSPLLLENSQFNVNVNWADYLHGAFNISVDNEGYMGFQNVDSLRIVFRCKCEYWNTTAKAQISVKSEVTTHPNDDIIIDESSVIPYVEQVTTNESSVSYTNKSEFNPIAILAILPIMACLTRRKF